MTTVLSLSVPQPGRTKAPARAPAPGGSTSPSLAGSLNLGCRCRRGGAVAVGERFVAANIWVLSNRECQSGRPSYARTATRRRKARSLVVQETSVRNSHAHDYFQCGTGPSVLSRETNHFSYAADERRRPLFVEPWSLRSGRIREAFSCRKASVSGYFLSSFRSCSRSDFSFPE